MKTLLALIAFVGMVLPASAIEPGTYVVSFGSAGSDEEAFPGLLIAITEKQGELKASVIDDGYSSQVVITAIERGPAETFWEALELSIVLNPETKKLHRKMYLLSGKSEKLNWTPEEVTDFTGGAMAGSAGNWKHLVFAMHRISPSDFEAQANASNKEVESVEQGADGQSATAVSSKFE